MALRPNIVQIENRMRGIPDAALQQMLMQMTQTGQVGTPEYLMAAGEMQARKDMRAKANTPQANPQPVIADLLTAGAMPPPPMMPQGVAQGVPQGVAPEDAGGLAAMEAPNMESIDMAGGGLVAFASGGEIPRFQNAGLVQGMGSSGGFGFGPTSGKPLMPSPPELDELVKKYGRNVLKLFRSGVGMSPSNLLARSQDLNVGEQQYMDALRALNTEFGYNQNQLAGLSQADAIQRLETERRLAEAQKGKGPDVSKPKEITYFPQGVIPGGEPGGDQTKPGGGLDSLAKAQGLTYDQAREQAQKMLGKDLAALGDPLADIKAELKGASEQRKKDLEQNAWLRVAQVGFGVAAGDKNAIVQGIKDYGNDVKESDKISREDRKLLADIKRLEAADKRGDVIKSADYALEILKNDQANQRVQAQIASQERIANIYASRKQTLDPIVDRFLKMSFAEKAQLKATNPTQYAMLEQRASEVLLPPTVGTPDPSRIRP